MANEIQSGKVQLVTSGYAKAPPSAQYKIQTGLTIDEVRRESITVLYGDSGIGKTTVARSWPNPYFMMMTGGGEHRPLPLLGRKVPYVNIEGKNMLDACVAALCRAGALEKEIPGYAIGSIIIDQLPSLNNLQSGDVLTTVARTRENSETLAQGDFKQIRRRAHMMVNDLTRIPCHKVYLSTAELDKSFPDGTPIRMAPALSNSLIDDFLRFADFVLYMTMETVPDGPGRVRSQRIVYTQPGEIIMAGRPLPYLAKDSSGRLPAKIVIASPEFPLFDEIMKYMQ